MLVKHSIPIKKLLQISSLTLYQFVALSLINFTLFTQIYLFVCFVALRPKSTAMVMAGRSVHLTTLFPGQA